MSGTSSKHGIVLGLVGPVCAGKSEVCRLLRERGAETYEADAIVRQLYERADVKEAVRQTFGDDVFEASDQVNRGAIAAKIFGAYGDPELRRSLTEEILFPRTGQVLEAQIASFRGRAGPRDVLVLDAPTLFEAGRAGWCDRILLVTAPLERRRQWARARGWPEAEVERRDQAMMPQAEKRRQADHIVENTGSLTDLEVAVGRVWEQLQAGG